MINSNRPEFPKRAVVTAGMPYGNKELHSGHIGGMFIHADIFARFLRDRIGKDNVIFVSGTDCYGGTIELGYEEAVADGFEGTIVEYVTKNYKNQKETLEKYQISPNLYGASALYEAAEIHNALSEEVIKRLYEKNALSLRETHQFYDDEKEIFLNGRQVEGRCPIQGCKSEKAYADECSLGHQYRPDELINPISIISGKTPSRMAVKNWFFNLPEFHEELSETLTEWEKNPSFRKSTIPVIQDFLKKPSIFVKKEIVPEIENLKGIPEFSVIEEDKKPSLALVFENLDDVNRAVLILSENGIRYRTGKTLVPFRLSGNVKWGIPVPEIENVPDLTFWVWPESLWAPISFTKAYLGDGINGNKWEEWWKSDESQVYQFIGEDNIYFYGIAEIGMFKALDIGLKTPLIVPNHHLLYGKNKASSSGEIKPPMAGELLDHYTSEQLRMHFMNASLAVRSVRFEPKVFLGTEGSFDPVLNEGNLITNVFNRLVRSGFYSVQKYNDGIYPEGEISSQVKEKSDTLIKEYEQAMSEIALDRLFEMLNVYLRDANKDWSARSKSSEKEEIDSILRDTFHVIRVAITLLHPIVPEGVEMIREYLGIDDRIWNWDYIFEPLGFFIGSEHKFKFLEQRVDFFKKHESQLAK